ncbi:MAG: UDP-N-acetylmuramoyl-L-alanyl-D-glutamate--2,6-diaminopimelate ligase [Aquihabitans sp.]
MHLDDLLGAVKDRPGLRGLVTSGASTDRSAALDVTRADYDSRAVTPGSLFCCVPGEVHDGHDYAADAVASGAVALLVERPLHLGVVELQVTSVRQAMGPLAAVLAGSPSEALDVVGVTGTNGKTTVTHLLASILNHANITCGVIGTLTGTRTTPEAPDLQDQLAAFAADGAAAVAMEVSSHALDLHRVDGTRFRVGVFTNLSRDHLDHHGDMSHYFHAKARLFEPVRCDVAVLNLDDPHGRLLFDAAEVPALGYQIGDAEDLVVSATGSQFRWRGARVALPLAGRFNVSNALAAATAAAELGVTPEQVAAGLAAVPVIPGRFESIDEGQDFLAVVDFAHTPDGLEHLLTSAREIAGDGRVLVVLGAGGNRDRTKRPAMGEVVSRLADVVFLTSDNPRDEDPAAIMGHVQHGMEDPRQLVVQPDRRLAIVAAVAASRPGDVLLVAGKGHEATQIVGNVTTPFDDREVLRQALRRAGIAASEGEETR